MSGRLNLITRNLIYNNSTSFKPINLNGTGNDNYLKPIISSVSGTTISGTSAANDSIEVYSSISSIDANCKNAEVFLGITKANGSGNWTLNASGIGGGGIKAIARNSNNNTSEFSLCSTQTTFVNNGTLKKTLDASYYIVTGTLNFTFIEEYNDADSRLSFKVYKKPSSVLISSSTVTLPVSYGYNQYALNVSLLQNDFYTLEITNVKNEKFYLKFKKQ